MPCLQAGAAPGAARRHGKSWLDAFERTRAAKAERAGGVDRAKRRQKGDARQHGIAVAIDDADGASAAEFQQVGIAPGTAVACDEQRIEIVDPFPDDAVQVAPAVGIRRAAARGQRGGDGAFYRPRMRRRQAWSLRASRRVSSAAAAYSHSRRQAAVGDWPVLAGLRLPIDWHAVAVHPGIRERLNCMHSLQCFPAKALTALDRAIPFVRPSRCEVYLRTCYDRL